VEEHQHHGENHHHHDSSENGLSLFFSHFNHNSEIFSTDHLENVVKVVNEVPASLLFVSTSSFSKLLVLQPIKELHFCEEPLVIISPHLFSLQFRGPPTLI
jgi:hypothetical protein